MSGQMLRGVTIKDATKELGKGLSGNLENKEIAITTAGPSKDLAKKFKRGAFYTLSDGQHSWKVAFVNSDPGYAHFKVMEQLKK